MRAKQLLSKQLPFTKRNYLSVDTSGNRYGSYYGTVARSLNVEGVYVKKLRIKLKKHIIRKKKQQRPNKGRLNVWIRYKANAVYSKKSKNARMGSGKGKYVRKVYRLKPNQTLLEFSYFKLHWAKLIHRYLRKKFGLTLKWNIKKLSLLNAVPIVF